MVVKKPAEKKIKKGILTSSAKTEQRKEKKEQAHINVRAATLHIMGDLIQSIGVIIAAIVMKIEPDWLVIDPICTFVFSILVMFTTWPIFKECVNMVLESAPTNIDIVCLYNEILLLDSV